MTEPRIPTGTAALTRVPASIELRTDLVGLTEWSEELSWPEMVALAEYLDAFRVAKGGVIFEQNTEGQFLCLLVEGRVDIVRRDSTGTPKTLATVHAGKTFGEMSLIDGAPRSASAVAAEDTKLLVLTGENLRHLAQRHPYLGVALLMKLAKLMSHRLRQTSGMLVEFLED